MRISALEGKRVALWGFGREGRAAWAAIRARHPVLPLTVFCPAAECAQVQAAGDRLLCIAGEPDADALAGFDVVVKSPGISPYSPLAQAARERGAVFTSGTALWFAERPPGRVICVTGTKGKSTTSALIAHLLRGGGHRTALAGNIGLPLLELLAPVAPPAYWVIELSSYQTRDAVEPDVALVLNLFPEHLDWHGSQARYYDDKLALIDAARPRCVVLNARDRELQLRGRGREDVRWFDLPQGWHLREEWVFCGDEPVIDARELPLPGQHNRLNLCAALAAIDALGLDPRPLLAGVRRFRALPHRLQPIGTRDGIDYVDDSISTTPHASIAALQCFRDRPVAILVGGFDRGIDWDVFVRHVEREPPAAVLGMGQNGARIVERLREHGLGARCGLGVVLDLDAAIAAAEAMLPGHGVVLLSPGAPSFPTFRNYAERGRAFARAAGFDGDGEGIGGLGIA